MTTLNETPKANRLHIGFFGKRNSGKSSLVNSFAGQEASIVSDVAGTTTDPVYKAIEIHGLGACVLIDTAGFDDDDEKLGKIRIEKTLDAAEKSDIAVVVFSDEDISEELEWVERFKAKKTPMLAVVGKSDVKSNDTLLQKITQETKLKPISLSAKTGEGLDEFREAVIRLLPEDFEAKSITGELVSEQDLVLLVMPQDIQAPRGRLILPQVQTIRDLLDHKCLVMSVTTDQLDAALASLSRPPKLIITDSQVFRTVYEKKPPQSLLTSFSTLFAGYKGDLPYYIEGAKAIEALCENSRVLIAECCTHAPMSEDIGRVKLPRMLKNKIGEGLTVDIVSGTDFPQDLTPYDLIIQCGACMFNRKYVLSRIDRAKRQNIPMTNYGVAIAYLQGILDKITY